MDPVPLEMFLRTINKNIEFMGFEIRKIIGEDDGTQPSAFILGLHI